MPDYAIYLRKSRVDREAEGRGEGETLARHEAALRDLALRYELPLGAVYREIVSGDSIAARPVMQHLLAEVEAGRWAGVLVMEIERLARGNTMDQGMVAEAFQHSGTKIITPLKTYDPTDEFDQEYFEFGLFMSRREYQSINRRLQRGRLISAAEGKYLANRAPYGYRRVKLEGEKGYTLAPEPEEAAIIRCIFTLFAHPEDSGQPLGAARIARWLNDRGIPSATGGNWSPATIRDILANPVYNGKIRWNWRKTVKTRIDGRMIRSRPRGAPTDCKLYEGRHPAIIEDPLWQAAQARLQLHRAPAVPGRRQMQNPLCGLLRCGNCGRSLIRRATVGKPPVLLCAGPGCGMASSYLHLVEQQLLRALTLWMEPHRIPMERDSAPEQNPEQIAIPWLQGEQENLRRQQSRLHDLLEQGIYDPATFQQRTAILSRRLHELEAALLQSTPESQPIPEPIPAPEHFAAVYAALPDPAQRNALLKEALAKVIYRKAKAARWGDPLDFELVLYPRIDNPAVPTN